MSLFPQGASSGMQNFQGGMQKKSENTPEIEGGVENTSPVSEPENIQENDIPPVPPVAISPLQAKLLQFQSESEKEVVSVPVASEEIQNQVETPEIQTPAEPAVAFVLPEEPIETASIPVVTSETQVLKPSSKITLSEDFSFPTSVKIVGLTADESYDFQDAFTPGMPQVSSSSSDEEHELHKENLSDAERAELEDMDSLYFEHFDPAVNPAGGVSLDELLDLAIDKNASDIHFAADSKVGLRINGHIYFIDNIPALTRDQARAIIFALVPNPLHRRRIFENKELDSAYEHKNGINFRVNIFFKRGKIAGVLRQIASHAMTMEQLGLPLAIKSLLGKKQGLFLVTGPTGSGKSTSMQSMLEYINQSRVEHILTIEDPIEYLFTNVKSIFSQREVGRDTYSFADALRASLREDPDIVMIGEMRDAETIEAAMKLSETGHLVISTLHTSSAPQTIARLVSHFPSDEQEQVQSRLADTLIGVLSQRLVSRADREGRVALFELMIVNSAIRNIIRTGDMTQIHNAMMSGREAGMVLMQDYGETLAAQGIVKKESFENFFREE